MVTTVFWLCFSDGFSRYFGVCISKIDNPELVINYLIESMEEDYKGMADERVKRFLAFIKKHEKDQLRKIEEEGKKEEDYQVHKVNN